MTPDETGIVEVILTIVIVFALVAVIMLTRTLQAAEQIDAQVIDATASVKGVDRHLNAGCDPAQPGTCVTTAVPALGQTEALVKQIDIAAQPLTGEAAQIVTAIDSIDTTASSVRAQATSINATVHSIAAVVASIGASVISVHTSFTGIDGDALTIKGSGGLDLGISGIENRSGVLLDLVSGVRADASLIAAQAGGILAQARPICADHAVSFSRALVPVNATGAICRELQTP
jgi:hypothetical protein